MDDPHRVAPRSLSQRLHEWTIAKEALRSKVRDAFQSKPATEESFLDHHAKAVVSRTKVVAFLAAAGGVAVAASHDGYTDVTFAASVVFSIAALSSLLLLHLSSLARAKADVLGLLVAVSLKGVCMCALELPPAVEDCPSLDGSTTCDHLPSLLIWTRSAQSLIVAMVGILLLRLRARHGAVFVLATSVPYVAVAVLASAEVYTTDLALGLAFWGVGLACCVFVSRAIDVAERLHYSEQQRMAKAELEWNRQQRERSKISAILRNAEAIVAAVNAEGGSVLRSYEIDFAQITLCEGIGEGAYGTVHLGKLRGKQVGVKMVRSTNVTKLLMQDFINEMRIMAGLSHPNLVEFIGKCGCWKKADQLCIVLEFCPNGTLRGMIQHVAHEDATWVEFYEVVLGIVQGMKYLHHDLNGDPIVHRDLKPANILLSGEMQAKICDFGTSRRFRARNASSNFGRSMAMTMSLVGSPMFCAPEVLSSMPTNTKCDVYSFGVILLLVGCALAGTSPSAIRRQYAVAGKAGIASGWRPTLPRALHGTKLALLIVSLWSDDLEDRPAFEEIIPRLHDLKGALFGMVEEEAGLAVLNHVKFSPSTANESVNMKMTNELIKLTSQMQSLGARLSDLKVENGALKRIQNGDLNRGVVHKHIPSQSEASGEPTERTVENDDARTEQKLLLALKSKLVDLQRHRDAAKLDRKITQTLKREHDIGYRLQVLMLGTSNAGKSTIFKQLRLLHSDEINDETNRIGFAVFIRQNFIDLVCDLVKGLNGIQSAPPFRDALETAPDANDPILLNAALGLWTEDEVSREFERRREEVRDLKANAVHLAKRAAAICSEDYMPSVSDLLFMRKPTALETADLEVQLPEFSNRSFPMTFIDPGGQRSLRRRWIFLFEHVQSVIFVASLAGYNENVGRENSLRESIEVFKEVMAAPALAKAPVTLFLNKSDVFRHKIAKHSIGKHFKTAPQGDSGRDYEAALRFVEKRFMKAAQGQHDRLNVVVTNATDTNQAKFVLGQTLAALFDGNMDRAGLS